MDHTKRDTAYLDSSRREFSNDGLEIVVALAFFFLIDFLYVYTGDPIRPYVRIHHPIQKAAVPKFATICHPKLCILMCINRITAIRPGKKRQTKRSSMDPLIETDRCSASGIEPAA